MTWKNESHRHSLAKKRISTKLYDGRINEKIEYLIDYLMQLRKVFEWEIEHIKSSKVKTPEMIGFSDIVEKAINDKRLNDEQVHRITAYASMLYTDYLKETKKYL